MYTKKYFFQFPKQKLFVKIGDRKKCHPVFFFNFISFLNAKKLHKKILVFVTPKIWRFVKSIAASLKFLTAKVPGTSAPQTRKNMG